VSSPCKFNYLVGKTNAITEPAVRLQSLRPGILQRANPSQYSEYPLDFLAIHHKKLTRYPAYAKKHNYANGKNPTDYTSFYAPWQGCGKDRASRSSLLFQIQVANAHKQEPTGYMMDRTRIVLDAWDHGIRDFPELPEAISSAIEGHDVEDLMRRNLAIKLYDVLGK